MAKIKPVLTQTKDGLKLELSSPSVGDAEEALRTVQVIIRDSAHLLTTEEEFTFTVEQQAARITSYLEHPDKVIIVPKVGGKIVGMMDFLCGSRKRIAHQGEFGMSVHPDYQGRGIGRKMLEALIDWATSNPRLETLRLKVHAQNTNAIRLYETSGFRLEGREVRGVKLSADQYDDVLIMARDVK
jgi:RimJ/RimL family protein N-acetyltransferase